MLQISNYYEKTARLFKKTSSSERMVGFLVSSPFTPHDLALSSMADAMDHPALTDKP